MKRSRFLLSTITAAVLAGLSLSGCDKKTPEQPKPPQATDATKPAETGKTAETPKVSPAAAPAVASAADVAKLSGTYGFVARLPKDVEGFGASYRLHELWTGLANSKWAATLLDLPPIKDDPQLAKIREQWNSEQGQQARAVMEALFGHEFTMAMPAGFTSKLKPWVDLFAVYQQTVIQAYFMMGMSGGAPNPDRIQQMIKDAAPAFLPHLTKCEIPPFVFAFKANKIRPMVDGMAKQMVQMIGTELPPAFEPGQFKLSDKYDFQSITVNAKKLVADFQEAKIEAQLKELLGDEAKAKEALAAIVSKRVEVAWGWVDDYLIVSVGSDHNHLKLAVSEADSALAIGEVAKRGAQFAAQRPLGLSYVSKTVFEGIQGEIAFADQFKTFAEELQGIVKPEQIEAMVADVRRLEGKAKVLFTTTYEPLVQVDLWEGGFRTEMFGGAKQKAFNSSQPLTFGGLATGSTFAMLNARGNAEYSKATADFIEDAAGTLWTWYDKYGRPMVPETERQGAAMIEMMAKPMVQEFWKASRKLGQGLGDESAFIVDLAGSMPTIPDLPPFLSEGKVPRMAWVSALKDRAALSEAWTGYSSLIKQIGAFAAQGQPLPEPQMKKEGDIELHYVQLPMQTGDLLPHVAISKDRWLLSTSPSLTKEIAAKGSTPGNMPMGSHSNVNFSALVDFANGWLQLVDKNKAQMFSPADLAEFDKSRPLFDAGIKLARSVQSFEWHVHEEAGQQRNSVRLRLQDAP